MRSDPRLAWSGGGPWNTGPGRSQAAGGAPGRACSRWVGTGLQAGSGHAERPQLPVRRPDCWRRVSLCSGLPAELSGRSVASAECAGVEPASGQRSSRTGALRGPRVFAAEAHAALRLPLPQAAAVPLPAVRPGQVHRVRRRQVSVGSCHHRSDGGAISGLHGHRARLALRGMDMGLRVGGGRGTWSAPFRRGGQ